MIAPQIPVTVLTGFLGAGKTTLLNRILTEPHGHRYAVIINEFGETGIDNDLVVNADEEIFEMNNGCICCTVRGDLIRILDGLMKRRDFDAILIETTGLADPAPVAQTFYVDPDVAARTRLDAIVTVVDAVNLATHLDEAHEAAEQIAFADVVLLNKIDLVPPAQLDGLQARIRRINPYARIHPCQRGDVPLNAILDLQAFTLERVLDIEPDFLDENHTHEHDEEIGSVSLQLHTPLDPARFDRWFGELLATHGTDLLRCKGILDVAGEPRRYVIQGVHMLTDGNFLDAWPAGQPRVSKLVFIGRHLDRMQLREGFSACASA
ncbi:nitrile hydratase activator [Xanthomonas bromi]|uniref:GTP-binding protein n=1 Tax=Xanthomonas bromi TaxID=56449 RepID=A0A1C3NNJ8_9XANT|nr:GTP-binding protein [Xanthomonas bromi]PPV06517.1 GTP-binding protein [Xanthomonas bromi]SBV51904.1 nitrile hydratase activator [Xanthomonas bromi]